MRVTGLARGLGDPLRLIEERQQRLDVSGERLALATRQLVERRGHALAAARLVSPVAVLIAKQQALVAEARVLEGAMRRYVGDTRQKIERTTDRIEQYGERLQRCGSELLAHGQRQVDQLGKLLESYSFHSVLNRGFALVRDQDGHPVMTAAETRAGDTIAIEFADGRVGARVTEGAAAAPPRRRRSAAPPRRRQRQSGIVVVRGKHHDCRAAVGRDHQELPVCQHGHRLDADAEARLSQQRHQRRAPAQSQGDAPRRAGLHAALHSGPRGSRQAADAQRSAERATRGDRGARRPATCW